MNYAFISSPCKQQPQWWKTVLLQVNVWRWMCAGGLGGHRGPPPTTTSTSPALNSLLHLTPNICLLLWRPPSTCRRSFHTCHKFFSRGDKLYDAATLLLSCASICAAPPLTRETRLAAFVSLNIADLSAGEAAAHYCGCSSFIYFHTWTLWMLLNFRH